ncbi:MAG: hypothetical protein AAF995_06225, partial [Planctomycetota bacterium]
QLGLCVAAQIAQLMGVKNFGATSLVELHEKLGELGLSLRTIDEAEAAAAAAGLAMPPSF